MKYYVFEYLPGPRIDEFGYRRGRYYRFSDRKKAKAFAAKRKNREYISSTDPELRSFKWLSMIDILSIPYDEGETNV